MAGEIAAAIQSVRVVTDIIKANHTLRNFNELVTAVYEVNAKLLTVQSVAMEAQEKQATLAERIRELEKEMMELKDWDTEKKRYQLTQIALGIFAYALKPGMEQNEPPHYLCTNCFTQKEKSILQAEAAGPQVFAYRCPRCQSKLPVAIRPINTPVVRG